MAGRSHKRKDVPEEEWKEISKILKQCRDELNHIVVDKIQYILPVKTYSLLLKASTNIDNVRSELEEEMFRQGIQDINIFYPGDNNK
jgi:hypothetical protein